VISEPADDSICLEITLLDTQASRGDTGERA